MTPEDFLHELEEAWIATTKADQSYGPSAGDAPPKRTYLWASQLWDCARRSTFDLLHPGLAQLQFDDTLLEIFERGKEREHALRNRLSQVGPRCRPPFEIVDNQRRFALNDRDGTTLLTGKVDGRLAIKGISHRPVFEAKSGRSAQNAWSLEALAQSKWTRHWARQLLAYLYALEEPWGLLVLDTWGPPRFLIVKLEDYYDELEKVLGRARLAIESAKSGDLPPFVEDRELCRACPYRNNQCAPPEVWGAGMVLLGQREEDLARTIMETAPAAQEHERARKALSERMAERRITHALAGPFHVSGTFSKRKRYDVPKAIQAKYTVESEAFTMKVERTPDF